MSEARTSIRMAPQWAIGAAMLLLLASPRVDGLFEDEYDASEVIDKSPVSWPWTVAEIRDLKEN